MSTATNMPIPATATPAWARRAESLSHDGVSVLTIAILLGRSDAEIATALGVDGPAPDPQDPTADPAGTSVAIPLDLPGEWFGGTDEQLVLDLRLNDAPVGNETDAPDEDLLSPATRGEWTLPVIVEVARRGRGRRSDMVLRYANGETLAEIAAAWNLTRERVRQIIGQGSPDVPTIAAARRRFAQEGEESDRAAVLQWSQHHVGSSAEQAAEDLALPLDRVNTLLGRRRRLHAPVRKPRPSTRRSDDDLLRDLRRFHAETGSTAALQFSAWAKKQGVCGHQTVMIRFDGWNRALRLAGISESASRHRERRHDDSDLLAAVVEAMSLGHCSIREIEEWLSATDGAPSLALIRARLSHMSWTDIQTTARRVLADDPSLDLTWRTEIRRTRNWADMAESHGSPIDDIRDAVADIGPSLSLQRYNTWAREHQRPNAATLIRRSETEWAELVTAAGGRPGSPRPKWTCEETLLETVEEFLRAHPDGSIADYTAWRSGRVAPSISTLASRFDGWEGAKDRARQRYAQATPGPVSEGAPAR